MDRRWTPERIMIDVRGPEGYRCLASPRYHLSGPYMDYADLSADGVQQPEAPSDCQAQSAMFDEEIIIFAGLTADL